MKIGGICKVISFQFLNLAALIMLKHAKTYIKLMLSQSRTPRGSHFGGPGTDFSWNDSTLVRGLILGQLFCLCHKFLLASFSCGIYHATFTYFPVLYIWRATSQVKFHTFFRSLHFLFHNFFLFSKSRRTVVLFRHGSVPLHYYRISEYKFSFPFFGFPWVISLPIFSFFVMRVCIFWEHFIA